MTPKVYRSKILEKHIKAHKGNGMTVPDPYYRTDKSERVTASGKHTPTIRDNVTTEIAHLRIYADAMSKFWHKLRNPRAEPPMYFFEPDMRTKYVKGSFLLLTPNSRTAHLVLAMETRHPETKRVNSNKKYLFVIDKNGNHYHKLVTKKTSPERRKELEKERKEKKRTDTYQLIVGRERAESVCHAFMSKRFPGEILTSSSLCEKLVLTQQDVHSEIMAWRRDFEDTLDTTIKRSEEKRNTGEEE